MGKELQPFVAAQVVGGRFIHRTGISRRQVGDLHRERLLILLQQLRLAGVEHTAHARWQHIVDRLPLAILLDIDGRDDQLRIGLGWNLGVGKILRIGTPITTHQLEGAEAEHGRIPETGHVHTHEADGLEVPNRAHGLVVAFHRDLEQVPLHCGFLAIHQGHLRRAHIHDVVHADLQILRAQGDLILKIFLGLVEGVIAVDVLHVGRALSGGGIALV